MFQRVQVVQLVQVVQVVQVVQEVQVVRVVRMISLDDMQYAFRKYMVFIDAKLSRKFEISRL